MSARFVGGLLVGVIGSGTVASRLFALFEWLGVAMNPGAGRVGLLGWAAMLATWAAAEFIGQTIAANVARSVAVIWFVAATHASILLFTYYHEPQLALLLGAFMGFIIAWRIKDSDFVQMGRAVSAAR